MSDQWNEGYLTEVGYTYGYYREINPVFQRFCLLLRGFDAPDPGAGGAHCELGFGQGVSINVHAAANGGRFVGTDFNPGHAAHALDLAGPAPAHAALFDDSFQQLSDRGDLPQFDSISLHGIWTWVSLENQAVIVEFVRRRLKPGGVLYLSYNCFPGWSPAYPLRHLFAIHDQYAATPAAPAARVEAALDFAERLFAAKPQYLNGAPQLPGRLEKIKEQDRAYLAHEYFNREWNCMYFTDVVGKLGPAKVDFACSASPLDAVDAVNLSAEAQQFLGGIADPILREQARDYFINQQFRRDLFVRGPQRLEPFDRQRRLLDTRFVLLQHPDDVAMKILTPVGEAVLQEDIYRPLLTTLAEEGFRPKTLRELAAATPQLKPQQLEQAVIVLVSSSAVAPCQGEAAAKEARPRCAALNRRLMERAIFNNRIEVLASPVTGGGVGVTRFQQLFLAARAAGRKGPDQWADHAWQIVQAQTQRIVKEGKVLETPEDNIAELKEQARAFAERRLPVLSALQVA